MQSRKMLRQDGFETATAWCAGCAVGYLLLSILGSMIGGVLLEKWRLGPGAGASIVRYEWMAWCANLAFSTIGLLIPILLALGLGHLPRHQLRWNMPKKDVLLPALAVYLGGSQLAGIAASWIGQATGSTQVISLPESGSACILAFFVLCVVPPVLEETLFRGAMQGFLRPYGFWLAIVGQAVPFSLLHGSASAAFFALLTGIFFGWLAEYSNSILPGMVLHFVNNTMAFVQMLLINNGAAGAAQMLSILCLLILPIVGLLVLVWWIRQGGLLQKLERVSRVDRLLYSVPWMLTQIFLLIFCLFLA